MERFSNLPATAGGEATRNELLRLVSLFLATLLLAWTPVVNADAFSHAALDTVLRAHLHDGRVNYGELASDRGPLDRYLAATESVKPDTWPRDEQIAFWVNVYNARVLGGVIHHPRLKSVLDVGRTLGVPTLGFFREQFMVAGQKLSLNDIEHGILRARFHEPRVHFVLNCASASCPVLPEHPLTSAGLEGQLEKAAVRFLTDRSRNHIDPAKSLEVSSIFKWYGDDFKAAAESVQGFIERHWPRKERFAPKLPVRFLDYDWSLNGSW